MSVKVGYLSDTGKCNHCQYHKQLSSNLDSSDYSHHISFSPSLSPLSLSLLFLSLTLSLSLSLSQLWFSLYCLIFFKWFCFLKNVVLAHEYILCKIEVIAFYILLKYSKGEELDKLLLLF